MPSLHRDVPNSTPGKRILLTPTWWKSSIQWLSFVPFPSRDSDPSRFLTSSLPPPLTPTHLLPSHFLSPTSKNSRHLPALFDKCLPAAPSAGARPNCLQEPFPIPAVAWPPLLSPIPSITASTNQRVSRLCQGMMVAQPQL